ncbi:MAG: hypothetical protein COA96_10770 [SAR86 cluster bacterium]|uniref:DUF1302 domain-containing protein n=1 Tax=SAR86 cluster bacterium TaxID=2030880 RepID=A0A2A5AXI7_9GAMM|nr:MAG: hypothetical protein COA96_10770 [SAR86 cluster bacterium]
MNRSLTIPLWLGIFALAPVHLGYAQDDVLILGDDVSFDAGFGFDDDLFGDAFAEEEPGQLSAWLENFTIKISQQLSGQTNNHGVDLAPGLSFPRESEIETNRLALNIRYQNAFAPGWLLQGSGQAKVYWKDDYEYKANGDSIDTEFRVNELFIQHSFDQHSLKFGRQTVVWGETVGNSVLDIINHSEFRDFTIIDIEDARLNQLMLVWDFFGEESNFSSFVNLYPEFNPASVRGSPFFFEPEFNLTDYDRDGELLFEFGTHWKKSFEGSDIAFMAAYLYENQLRYEDPVLGIGDAVAEKNDFILLGFSANRAIGKLLLNFDLAFSHNVLADSFNFPGTTSLTSAINLKKDQIGTSFGFEYAINNDQSVSLGIQAQMLLDEDEGLLPGQTLINDGVFGTWLVRYSNSLMNGDLVLSSTLQGDLNAESLLALFGADYTINDNWAINGQIINISADDNSPLLFFAEDLRVGITVTYSY